MGKKGRSLNKMFFHKEEIASSATRALRRVEKVISRMTGSWRAA